MMLTTPPVLNVLYVVALLGLALALLAEQIQVLAKYQGVMKKRIARGYNLAMKVMVINRVGAVLLFLLISYNIDNGIPPNKLAFGFGITVFLISIPTIGLILYLRKNTIEIESGARALDLSTWPKPIVAATFVATIFNVLGLTVPWVAAASFPEIRLTLANSSFLFNTIFTLVNVFYIEHRLAHLIDEDISRVHGFIFGVMAARLASYLIFGAATGLYLLI